MVEEDTVKLIDMGAVRRVDDAGRRRLRIQGLHARLRPVDNPRPSRTSTASRGRSPCSSPASTSRTNTSSPLPPPSECEVFREHEAALPLSAQGDARTSPRNDSRPPPRWQSSSSACSAPPVVGERRGIFGPAGGPMFAADSDHRRGRGRRAQAEARRRRPEPRGSTPRTPAASVILAAGAVPDAERRHALFAARPKAVPGFAKLKLRTIDELVSLGRFGGAEAGMAEVRRRPRPTGAWPGTAVAPAGAGQDAGDARRVRGHPQRDSRRAPLGRLLRWRTRHRREARAGHSLLRCGLARGYLVHQRSLWPCALPREKRRPSTGRGRPTAVSRPPPAAIRRPKLPSPSYSSRLLPGRHPPVADLTAASAALLAVEEAVDGLDVQLLRAELLSTSVAAAVHLPAAAGHETILGVPLAPRGQARLAAEAAYRECPTREDRTGTLPSRGPGQRRSAGDKWV